MHPTTPPPRTWPRRQVLHAGVGLAALGSVPAWAQFRIEISGVGGTQLPIVVADFRGEAEAGLPLAAVLRADLERSGAFRLMNAGQALDDRSDLDPAAWRARGADALVAGSITRAADGRLEVRYRLWDAVKGEQLVGQSKTVVAGDLRLAAHRIADEIVLRLTGERGANATRIAYVVRRGRRYSLHITDADGEGGQVALASNDPIISPAWAPDGRQIAYVSFEMQKAVVWVQDLVTGQRRVLANFRGSNSAPAFSPDGTQLAVALAQGGLTQLFTMPVFGGGAPRRLTSSSAIDTEPVYAPDGRSIFFVSDRGGGPQIYRVAASGGTPERISFGAEYCASPDISPDGRTLAYIGRQGSAYRVMTQDLATGTVAALTGTQDDESPSFAPNGRLLVYSTRQGRSDVLMTTTLDGKIKTRLLSTDADMREPAWGPFIV